MFLKMNKFFLRPIFVAVALAGGAGATAASTLCVRVVDPANLPLPAAWVNIAELKTSALYTLQTDTAGKACATKLPEGLYSVEVGLTGFLNVRYYPVRVTTDWTKELEFRLPLGEAIYESVSQEAIFSGTLKTDEGGLAGAKICVKGTANDRLITCTTTNDLGEYVLVVPPGSYNIELRAPGGRIYQSKIAAPAVGQYRDRISIPVDPDKK
jgi:hypothetical protein